MCSAGDTWTLEVTPWNLQPWVASMTLPLSTLIKTFQRVRGGSSVGGDEVCKTSKVSWLYALLSDVIFHDTQIRLLSPGNEKDLPL